ncbi:protein dispatched homolog 1-like [Ixodes scapularis]|uniref:protein dispatched homolog 1-like n=1 Tax=Ixodes scapularis TaxID=6945 RepID=UPI001C384780|nr:protein dispatched homolog 1-like [Ixodes scapularis]
MAWLPVTGWIYVAEPFESGGGLRHLAGVERSSTASVSPCRYSQQVANHPSVVILVVFSLATTAIVVSFTTRELPSFKDPLLGFEPRGTVLAQRATAWNNLLAGSSWNGPLSMYPGPQEQQGPPLPSTTEASAAATPSSNIDAEQAGGILFGH